MGACCTTARQQTIPDTTSIQSERQPKKSSVGSDSDSSDDTYLDTMTTEPEEDGGNETSLSITSNIKERTKIISGFKKAVNNGNDSLVMYYNQEHESLNLLDLRFPNDDTSLHIAVRKKYTKLTLYLLNEGISPNAQNSAGDTPLHVAIDGLTEFEHGKYNMKLTLNIVTLLLKEEADVNIENHIHKTALTLASEIKDKEERNDMMELLSPMTQNLIGRHITSLSQSYDDEIDDVPMLDKLNTHRLNTLVDDIVEPTPKLNNDESSLKPPKNYEIYQQIDRKKKKKKNNDYKNKRLSLTDERSLEEKLDKKSRQKLQEIKIARSNPFSKLQRRNTQKALVAMQNITEEAGKLPKLEAWLEKKKQKPPYVWQKRWVIVKDSHFLWSDKQRSLKDPKSAKERGKFNGNLNLMMMTRVEKIIKGKSQRKFVIDAKEGSNSKMRTYTFRAASEEDRNYWVKSLNLHRKHMKELVEYLGTKR